MRRATAPRAARTQTQRRSLRWLPRAQAGAGRSALAGRQGSRWPRPTWRRRTLTVEKLATWTVEDADNRLTFPAGAGFGAPADRLTGRTLDASGSANLESREANVTGKVSWWEQAAALRGPIWRAWLAAGGGDDSGRRVAAAPARSWKLGRTLRHGAGHGKIGVGATGHFDAEGRCKGEPLARKNRASLWSDAPRARRRPDVITVEALQATLPGSTARLSGPVTIDRQGKSS